VSLLASTSGSDLQPLRVTSIPVVLSYRQIVDLLQRSLSADHAALLAEPSIDRTTNDIQWYSRVPGTGRPLASLNAEERSAADLRLAGLIDSIHKYADELAKSEKPADHLAAENLRAALEVPAENDDIANNVYVVGTQPVLVGWGHVRRGPVERRRLLRVMATRRLEQAKLDEEKANAPPPPPPPPTSPSAAAAPPHDRPYQSPYTATPASDDDSGLERTESGLWRMYVTPHSRGSLFAAYAGWWSGLGWLLFTLLAIVIGWLLLKYCAIGLPSFIAINDRPLLDYCSRSGGDGDIASLRRRIDELDELIRQRQRACTVERPPQRPVTPPGSSTGRVEEQGGRIGAVNVILTWDTSDDLDLQVSCPGGNPRINYSTKINCGGKLDVDRNAGPGSMAVRPVVNIVWEAGAAPRGKFTVEVQRYQSRQAGPTSFTVELQIDGVTVETRRGQISADKVENRVLEFELPRPR
jgi:hypothetical protein